MRHTWTGDEGQKLSEQRHKGRSLTEIASALYVSRCAVAGKMYRLGLTMDVHEIRFAQRRSNIHRGQ
jgi:hypothetical protein